MTESILEEEIARRMGVGEEAIRAARAHPRGLASGLYAQGAIDTDRFEELVSAVRKTVAQTVVRHQTLPMVCSGCGARWRVRNAHPAKRYGCKKCRKPLALDLSSRSLSGGEEAEQPGESRELPPEVLAAMEQPTNLFGKYVLLGEVGRGGMGRVYRGYDTELGRTVALKVMLFQSEEDLARFRQEAFLAAKLDHPGIVQVHELGEVEGRPFIAMQYVEGKSLESGKMPPKRAVEAVRDAARAIAYAHRHGVIHRDVKPSNLLESKDGRIRVTDFGLAKQAGAASVSGSVVGTPSFMSPEQARGDTKLVGPRSDVYSLGATLYGLLVGDSPFPGASVPAILHQVATRDPVSLRRRARVPGDLETLVLQAMEKDPNRRYQTAGELADDLDRFLQGEPILARRASVFYRLRKTVAKRKAAVSIGLLGLVGVIAVAAYSVPRIGEERTAKERAESEVRSLRELTTLWTQVVLAKQGFHNKTNDPARVRSKIRDLVGPVTDFIRANPDLPQGYYIRARARLYLTDLAAAEEDLRTAVRLQPGFAPGHGLLGRVKFEQYQWRMYTNPQFQKNAMRDLAPMLDEARRDLARGVDEGGGRASIDKWGLVKTQEDEVARVMTQALWAIVVDKKNEKAVEILKAADAQEPAAEYCNLLGLSLTDREERVRWQTRAIDLMPLWGKPYLDRAWDRGERKELDLAMEDYNRALELDPGRSVAWVNRGLLHYHNKNFAQALKDLDEAIRLDPGLAAGYWNRCLIRRGAGDREGALADATRVIELEPRHDGSVLQRFQMRYELKDLKGAEADGDRLVELRPDSATSWFSRGVVRSFNGDLTGALTDYTRALELKPNDGEIFNNRGGVRLRLGDGPGALEDADRAIQLLPTLANAWAVRAGARQLVGDLEGAVADFDQAIRLKPENASSYHHRGLVKIRKGDLAGARADLEQAREKGPETPELDASWGRLYAELSAKEPGKARAHLQAALAALEKSLARTPGFRDPKAKAEAETLLQNVRRAMGR